MLFGCTRFEVAVKDVAGVEVCHAARRAQRQMHNVAPAQLQPGRVQQPVQRTWLDETALVCHVLQLAKLERGAMRRQLSCSPAACTASLWSAGIQVCKRIALGVCTLQQAPGTVRQPLQRHTHPA